MPQIDRWRPEIQAQLSEMLDLPVQLGEIRAGWQGWNPVFEFDDVVLRNARGVVLLSIPQTRARLSWRSILRLRPGLRVSVRGMDLALRRDAEDSVRILGQRIQARGQGGGDARWLAWLVAQPSIALLDTTIRWRDDWRAAPELVFTDVQAILDGSVHGVLSASFSMRPPDDLGQGVEVRARFEDSERLAQGEWPHAYRVYAALEDVRAAAWRPWVDVPPPLRDGRATLRAWAEAGPTGEIADPRMTLEAAVDDVDWTQSSTTRFLAPRVRVYAQGPWSGWRAAVGGAPDADHPLHIAIQTRGLVLSNPEWFQHPIALGWLDAEARLRLGDSPSVDLDQLRWRNPDIDVSASGTWRANDRAGLINVQGVIARAQLAAIHRYLPLEVDADARDWLAHGLKAGILTDARLRLSGELAEFPFGDHPEAGDFLVAGPYRSAVIDYVPAEPTWPMLQDMDGTAELHRVALSLTARQARMRPTDDTVIDLADLRAAIPDIENDAILTVSGETRASGADYMALLAHTPLSGLLDEVFDDARASGAWQVPLTLTIPLAHSEDARVDGRVVLDDAALRLMPGMPEFEGLKGALHFTEEGIEPEPGFTLRVLGGEAGLSGRLSAGQGLAMRGRMTAEALAAYVGVPGMSRVTGTLPYEVRLARGDRGYRLALASDLRGLALDFPAPLAKPGPQARTLQVVWSNQEARDDTLSVDLGTDLSVRLRHRRGKRVGPYFWAASVGLNRAAPPPAGLTIDMAYPLLDMDVWNDIVGEFSAQSDGRKGGEAAREVFPELEALSLQADEVRLLGMRLDHAVLRLVHDPDADQWSMNVRSSQTSGTLKWSEKNGQVVGRVAGRFARLSLGDDPAEGPSLLPEITTKEISFDDELDIPAIVLQADDLRIYGHSTGRLALEGVKDAATGDWRLESLSLGDEHAKVRGTGLWRLRGPRRGLHLTAAAEISNLGEWLDRAGFRDVMTGGKGTLKGNFEWRDLPWTHDKANLGSMLEISLDEGRFSKLGSQSAKLLELLSLQSIARLSSLDQGLSGLTKEGFPFDQLRGKLDLSRGVVQARDYKVIGPVGTILLEGASNIIDETFDMQAVIVPNLDVSGAAIAAGIAINPVIGIGAFLSQWVLKNPLARAMTVRYRVTGPWDDPVVTEVGGADAPTADKAER
ncbi:YhdP family protein [Castellaniella sp. GW247-6E4]|uniref:YhdP family protein n=1 Tax=Castellaniella sp. GW247-6E4 TaxID=3140380 RepID=UPI0033158764